jgi:hypothetical protein
MPAIKGKGFVMVRGLAERRLGAKSGPAERAAAPTPNPEARLTTMLAR